MKKAERPDDMSPDGKLVLFLQDDRDVIVNIRPSKDSDYEGSPFGVSVEFCTHVGGGQSPNTLRALHALIEAMELDNTGN